MRLYEAKVPVLGTSPLDIDKAEDRNKFSELCDSLHIDQPKWKELTHVDDIMKFADEVGFPLLIRPSYVLSGAAMSVVSNKTELGHFLELAAMVSKQYPVVVSQFLENTKEVDFDAVAQNGELVLYAISEHQEFAGVHSGDATMLFPPQKLYVETVRRIKQIAKKLAKALNISGPFNMQFLAKDNDVKVIELNLRASRSFPFVSKVLKCNFIEYATDIMLGLKVTPPSKTLFDLEYVGVKAPQFSFARLAKADPTLGVEMASTGEVGCLGENYYEAILKSMLSVGYKIPKKNILISSGPIKSKMTLLNPVKELKAKGYNIYCTQGSSNFFHDNGVETTVVHWPDDDRKPNIAEMIKEHKFDLVINVPKNLSKTELDKDYVIRRLAIDFNIPLLTNARLAAAFIGAFLRYGIDDLNIKAWNEY
ncbi:MAG: ATP-grasp domain-containing protein, partial [Bacteroidales bacterium]|nr:ATP-grasp domain-containing protein [Bacteroidales bacterium]